MASPLLLGHRGSRMSRSIPENTCAAFDLALQNGCHGFEFDARLAANGTVLVCHDPKVGRLTISRTQANKLPSLPRLDDILQRYCDQAFLDIELKVGNMESKVLRALHEHPPRQGYVVSSFLPEVVMDLEARNGTLAIGIICETRAQLARWPTLPADFVIAQHSLVDRALVRQVQGAGLKMMAWTVNDAQTMLQLAEWGVDGIISDDTALLARTLK